MKKLLVLLCLISALCVLAAGCTDPADIDTTPQLKPTQEAVSQPTATPITEPEASTQETTQPALRPNDTPFA